MDVVGLNGLDHVVHQGLAAHQDTPHGADVTQCIQDAGLALRVDTIEETDDADDTLELDALEALSKSASAANLNNVVHTRVVRSELPGGLTPVGVGLVVDDMIGTELLQLLSLGCGGSGSDDGRASSFSELSRKTNK